MLASEQRYLAEIILTQLTIKVPKIPILLVSPKFSETETETFFPVTKFSETETLKKLAKVLKPRSFETELSISVAQCFDFDKT